MIELQDSDTPIPLDELSSDHLDQLSRENKGLAENEPKKNLIVDASGSKPLLMEDEVLDYIEQFIKPKWKEALGTKNPTKRVALKKEIILESLEKGLAYGKILRMFECPSNTVSSWVTKDRTFAAHINLAKTRQKALSFRRDHLSKYLFLADTKDRKLGFQLGTIIQYDRDIAEIVLWELSEGTSLRDICFKMEMSPQTIIRWREKVPEFHEAYFHAKKISAEFRVDEIFDIVDGADEETKGGAMKAKGQAQARQWYAEALDPDQYGKRVNVEVKGQVDHVARLRGARNQAAKKREKIVKEVADATVLTIPAGDATIPTTIPRPDGEE